MFKENNSNNTINLSWASAWRLYAPLLILLGIWYFRSLILMLLVSFIVASLLEKPIDYISQRQVNRWLATALVYAVLIIGLGLLVYLGLEIINKNIPALINRLSVWFNLETTKEWWQKYGLNSIVSGNFWDTFNSGQGNLLSYAKQGISTISKIFGGTFSIVLLIIISFFINTEKDGIEKGIRFILPWQYEDYGVYLWTKARDKISGWFYSQLILSLFFGLMVFATFNILGVPYAEFLAVAAGLLDFIPYLGPFILMVISFLLGVTQSWGLGLMILLTLFILEQIEGFIAPLLRSKMMNLNPLIIIIALIVGGKLAGAIGIIIVLPLTATFLEFIKDWRSGRLESYLPQRRLV